MKAQIFITVLLMLALATNAQSSRRGEHERENNQHNSNSQNVRGNSNASSGRSINNNPRASQMNNANSHTNHTSTDVVNSNSTRRNPSYAVNRVENRPNRENERTRRAPVTFRHVVAETYHHPNHGPIEVHREWYHYRQPVHTEIFWSINMYHNFQIYYPEVHYWRYPIGHRFVSIPAYDANGYVGEVANIYGKVIDVYYDNENDEYYLYFGDYYPYHDFSIVIPGREARLFSFRPERYFENQHITVTGYVTSNEDKPEIVIHRASQVEVY